MGPARLEPPVTTGSFLPTYFLAVVSTSSGRINNQFPFISCQPQAWNAAGPRGLLGGGPDDYGLYGEEKTVLSNVLTFFLQGVHMERQCVNESKNTREKTPDPAKEELSKVVSEMSCGLSF